MATTSCPPEVLNIDLCLLSYQLYHQSVIWPLDPWYEYLARKFSDRRDNFMDAVHKWVEAEPAPAYLGPTALRPQWGRSNTALDPVITYPLNLNPRLPAFTRDGEKYLAVKAPSHITDSIRQVELSNYTAKPQSTNALAESGSTKIIPICDYPNGTDHLIAFEGGTGAMPGKDHAWSVMGFVLMRKQPENQSKHDVFVVFRGSRSGSAGRAAAQGLAANKGNPDWVTDMDALKNLNADLTIAKHGQVARGFANSVKSCLGSISAALRRINKLYGSPENIWVTGHSLGGGLAALFTSAIAVGQHGDRIRQKLKAWPWENLRAMPYALPTVGNKTFRGHFNLMVNSKFIWCAGDAVVWGGKQKPTKPFGSEGLTHVGANVRLEKPPSKENPHEPHLIRAAVIRALEQYGHTPAREVWTDTPWAYYKNFHDMMKGAAFSYVIPGAQRPQIITTGNLRSVLNRYHFASEFDYFLALLSDVVNLPSSYKSVLGISGKPKRHGREVKGSKITAARAGMKVVADGDQPGKIADKRVILDNLVQGVTQLKGTQGANTDKYLGLGLILNGIQKSNLTIAEIASRPKLREVLAA